MIPEGYGHEAPADWDPESGEVVYLDAAPDDGVHTGDTPDAHEVRTEAELRVLRAREEARRRLRAEQAGPGGRPAAVLLSELLAEDDEDVVYRLEHLWPAGSRVMLAAQYKAGKTTLTGNLVRSLVDGDPFLDRHAVLRTARRVAIIDTELSAGMLRRWLRDQQIQRTDAVAVYTLRGRVASFDLLDAAVRREWAEQLRALDVDVLVLDCLRPVLDALGLDENTDAGRFLVCFDALLDEAGIADALVVHHAGHGGERSRGSSRLRDWPDVEWRLVRGGDTDAPDAPRYFTAYGRDVDVPESELGINTLTRHLSVIGGSRKDAAARGCLPDVLEAIDAEPGLSQRKIELAVDASRKAVREALRLGIDEGVIRVETGPRNARQHYRNTTSAPVRRTAPPRTGAVSE